MGGGESSSRAFIEQLPCSFAYKIVSSVEPNLSKPLVVHRGDDAAEMFVRRLQEEAVWLHSFHTAINCHRCNQPLGVDKVRDHCHVVGELSG